MKILFVTLLVLSGCVDGKSADWLDEDIVKNVGNTMRCAYNKNNVCVCVWISAQDRKLGGLAIDHSRVSCR